MSSNRLAGGEAERLAWQEPTTPALSPEQREELSKRAGRAEITLRLLAGQRFDDVTFKTAAEYRAEDEAKAERERDTAEVQASREARAAAEADLAAARAELKATEQKIRQAEGTARRSAVDAEMVRIREDRARRGKRPLEDNELRSRASRAIAKGTA